MITCELEKKNVCKISSKYVKNTKKEEEKTEKIINKYDRRWLQ